MVFFTCNHCGESLKKVSVAKHYMQKCRGAAKNVSCMDCQKDFHGEEYDEHIRCISEEEKYSGKDYVPKENKNAGQRKQDSWMETVRAILESKEYKMSSSVRAAFQNLQSYDNVPRKQVKFQNFVKNCLRMNARDATNVWNILSQELEKMKQSSQQKSEENGKDDPGKTNGQSEDVVLEKKKAKKSKKQALEDESKENIEEEPTKKKKSKKRSAEEEAPGSEEKKSKKQEASTDSKEVSGEEEAILPEKKKTKEPKASTDLKKRTAEEEASVPAKVEKKSKKQEASANSKEVSAEEEAPVPEKKKSKKQEVSTDSKKVNAESENGKVEENTKGEEAPTNMKFDWSGAIFKIVNKKEEIPLEKLRDKVVKKYLSHSNIEVSSDKQGRKINKTFTKYLKKCKLNVTDETVKLVK